MTSIHSILFAIHILVGSAALVLFWIPVFSKKGQLNHVNFGRYYRTTMYAVAGSGAIMAIMVLLMPAVIKAQHFNGSANPEQVVFTLRLFWGFLLYLSLLSFVSTRHGMSVLAVKSDIAKLRVWRYQLPLWLLLIGGIGFVAAGTIYERTLHMVFGVLGILVAIGMLRYSFLKEVKNGQWVVEHLGAMIGSGIGAYTAFLAFGGRSLFADLGNWQLVFWIAPGVIGGIAANVIARNYAKKLGLFN